MSTYQTAYTAAPAIGLAGQVANTEVANIVSRTVMTAAGIAFGQPAFRGTNDHEVVAGGTFAATGVGADDGGNTGAQTITAAPTIGAGAKEGVYVITITEPASDAGVFQVEDPDGVVVGTGEVGTEYDADGLTFTISDGATDAASGDVHTITVSFTANDDFLGLAALTNAVPADATNPDKFPQYFTGGFMTMGQMYVVAGATVAAGDDVYWNPATSRFTNTETHIRIPNATFDTSGVDGGIVEVSLRQR